MTWQSTATCICNIFSSFSLFPFFGATCIYLHPTFLFVSWQKVNFHKISCCSVSADAAENGPNFVRPVRRSSVNSSFCSALLGGVSSGDEAQRRGRVELLGLPAPRRPPREPPRLLHLHLRWSFIISSILLLQYQVLTHFDCSQFSTDEMKLDEISKSW